MAVQNELLNLLQAESEATVVYAAIVLSQVWIAYSRIQMWIPKRKTLYKNETYFHILWSSVEVDSHSQYQVQLYPSLWLTLG